MGSFDYVAARESVYTSGLNIYARGVLMQIIEHMPNARPGVDRIATRAAMSRDQVMDEIKTLESLGILIVRRNVGRPSDYTLATNWQNLLPRCRGNRERTVTSGHQPPVDIGHQWTVATTPVDTSHGGSGRQPPLPVDASHPKQEVKQEDKQEGSRETRAKAPPAKTTARTKSKPPEAFEPTEATLIVAAETCRDWRTDWAQCRDWALGKGELKADWQATLRNWMRESARRETTRSGPKKVAAPQMHLAEGVEANEPSWLDELPVAQVIHLKGKT